MIPPQFAKVGQTVTFEGYADDYGSPVIAIEFSLDDGESWASQDVSAADSGLSVHWTYAFTPSEPGRYQLRVRSVAADGRRSPLAAIAEVFVE